MAREPGPTKPKGNKIDTTKLDNLVASARNNADARMKGYRERSLGLHPHVCARCGREFDRENLHELTVHHKDHNHDNNPSDGTNWENLCLYCHDWEHQKYTHLIVGEFANFGVTKEKPKAATHNPFASLGKMLDKKK